MYPNETQKYHTPSKMAWEVKLPTCIQTAHSSTNRDKIHPNWTFMRLHPVPPGKSQDGILNLDKTVTFNKLPKLIFHYHPVILQYSVCVIDNVIKQTKNYKIKATWFWIIYYWLYKTELNSVNKIPLALINISISTLGFTNAKA